MKTYRPEHQAWHDDLPEPCRCDEAWADRGMVDQRCWHHQAIDVLDTLGLGVLWLYRILYNESLDEVITEAVECGVLVRVWPPEGGSE